jgi:hypothetical protein
MNVMCALSLTVRLALLTFVAGFVLGLALGVREAAPDLPAPIPDQSPLAGGHQFPGQPNGSVNLHRTSPLRR